MQGGQKISIDLGAGVDTTTSDMLVNVQQPTFQHKWQRFQGNYLPNSLRFEKNGWAAGWNVYNFKYNTFRKKLDEGVFVELGQYNIYAKSINIYSSDNDADPEATHYVVPVNTVISGDVTLTGNTFSGKIDNVPFTVHWDKDTHTATIAGDNLQLDVQTSKDFTQAFTVTDKSKSFEFDLDISLADKLTSSSISPVNYSGFDGTEHSWDEYKYNVNTNKVTTPEGVIVDGTIDNNKISFSYDVQKDDEKALLNYQLLKYYTSFTKLKGSGAPLEDKPMTFGTNPSEQLEFNKTKLDLTPVTLESGEDKGVLIDWQVPVWATTGFTVKRANPVAKYCDNIKNREIAIKAGTGVGVSAKFINVYTGSEVDVELADAYNAAWQFVESDDLQYRFNQILVNNTIEPSKKWSPYKHSISSGAVWALNARQYYNLKNKNISLMKGLLGDVYTWGSFEYTPSDYITLNKPWDWADKDNVVYTQADISSIASIRGVSVPDNTDNAADEQIAEQYLPSKEEQLKMIAVLKENASLGEYSVGDPALTYTELYNGGRYIANSYATVDTSVDKAELWPFNKVPKFNLLLADGNVVTGCYWTDGLSYITDFEVFREKVIGVFDGDASPMNTVLSVNNNFCRTRIVKQYTAGYDFDQYTQEEFEAHDKFNNTWAIMYQDKVTNPFMYFDQANNSSDTTYLDYIDIEISEVSPEIYYLTPGVYLQGSLHAVPFGTSTGLILYEESDADKLVPFVKHGTVDVTEMYERVKTGDTYDFSWMYSPFARRQGGFRTTHFAGELDGRALPYYFGEATTQELICGPYSRAVSLFGKIIFGQHKLVPIKSAQLSLSFGWDYVKPSAAEMSAHHAVPRWEHVPETNKKYWFSSFRANLAGGVCNFEGATSNFGVIEGGAQCEGNINDGLKIALAIPGYLLSTLSYPEIKDEGSISQKGTFILEKVPSDELPSRLADKLFVDRDDIENSQALFFIDTDNFSVVADAGEDKGYVLLRLSGTSDDSGLYYAEKKTDTNNNEIIQPYYIPGTAYADSTSKVGNMSKYTDDLTVYIRWVPKYRKLINSASVSFNKTDTISTHKFYTNDIDVFILANTEIGKYDDKTSTMPVVVTLGDVSIGLTYNTITGEFTLDEPNIVLIDSEYSKVMLGDIVTNKSEFNVVLKLEVLLHYLNLTGRFYTTNTAGYKLVQCENDVLSIEDSSRGVMLKYIPVRQTIVSPTCKQTNIFMIDSFTQHINALNTVELNFIAAMTAVFDGSIDNNIVSFIYRNKEYQFDLTEAEQASTGISVISTDIRRPLDTKTIGLLKPEGQYQLLRQQWNSTIEVENFWWVDSTHILELNSFAFVLKRNTKELDDWNGNRFEKVFEVSREKVLPTNVLRYFVTNVYDSTVTALLCTLQLDVGTILIKLYNPREHMEEVTSLRLKVVNKELGKKLNDKSVDKGVACLNTYNPLTVEQVLSKAVWSNTIVDDRLIIGCHLSNNYDQWAIVFNLKNNTVESVIQGYGFVGLHGDLTGGMLPNDFFDKTYGFNDIVQPLEVLCKDNTEDLDNVDAAYEVGDVSKLNYIDTKVVGTSEQQWYIKNRVYGIVSHLTYSKDGKFDVQLLPMTNNYTAVYKSPSFGSSVIGDCMIIAKPFASLFELDGAAKIAWDTLLAACGYPMLFYMAPRYSMLAYLQQTLGQYAYVHNNTSKSMPEPDETKRDRSASAVNQSAMEKKDKVAAPLLSGAMTFDKQKFSQKLTVRLDFQSAGILPVLINALGASIDALAPKNAYINEEINMSAVADVGKQFIDNVALNASDYVVSQLGTPSKSNAGLTSVITGLKSLDMFYSTSDQQRIFAGPGFVEHQFVASCVAQSVTHVHCTGKVQTLFYCIAALTMFQLQLTKKLQELAIKGFTYLADDARTIAVCGTTVGPAVAAAFRAAASAMEIALAATAIATKEIEVIVNNFGAKITTTTEQTPDKSGLTTEGKHKYGEKNETFMWPCWGITTKQLKYTDEWAESGIKNTPWKCTLNSRLVYRPASVNFCNIISSLSVPAYSSNKATERGMSSTGGGGRYNESHCDLDNVAGDNWRAYFHSGSVPFYQAVVYGKSEERVLPDDMAKVEGVVSFLPKEPFKNENISVSDPAFTPSAFQDYIIDKQWDLSQFCTYGAQQWVAVKDTKVINCPPSNLYVNSNFCGIASPYTAVEVKRGIQKAYMRPWAVTSNALAFNCTGYNSILDNKLYHAFDGISYRLVDLIGAPGMNKNFQSFWYSFQLNDRFKRSNKAPANEFQGNFESEPVQASATIDKTWSLMTVASKEKGLEAGTIGEDKDLVRWAIPMFTEQISVLPAAVKTLTAMPLGVVEGVTSLCVHTANNQVAYKAPLSVDFTIGKQVYRVTEEYICSVSTTDGVDVVTDLIPCLGLTYIGATPAEAYFYSKATRHYYLFSGNSLVKVDMVERFRDVQKGHWDFVNQEIVMPCLMTFKRLNVEVEDKDTETDNIIVPVLSKGAFTGELPPPITTIFNDRSWYKGVSLPAGFAYQGPNRVIINRDVFVEYMTDSLKKNFGKWRKLNKEKYSLRRKYPEIYTDVLNEVKGVDGWTYNPFVLVTSPLGLNESTDSLFEWEITFCWPIEMDLLYGVDNYAVVNIAAETMTPGGKQRSRPVHVYLTKELFTRNGNYGYYSFRYQSKNGAGNRERLHVWSDQYIAISRLDCEIKVVTSRRTEQLTQQIDVQKLKEL